MSLQAPEISTAAKAVAQPLLRVEGISKTYVSDGREIRAIGDISFDVAENEFVSIVGPSGCGKTTLLKCISGLLEPSGGRVSLRGNDVVAPPKELAVVFQDYSRSLFPWMTVRRNIALPLRKRGDAAASRRQVAEALKAVGLDKFGESYPWQLSGGMQQRVAIARALAYQPQVLLMDEPFASVDAQTRADLEDLVLRVRREFGITVVLVTHDIDESVYMGDRVVVLGKPPTTVQHELVVDLPEVRDQISTKELPEFARLRAQVYRAIKGEPTAEPSAD
ncbi:ABC transporter ATP-binding protein [Aeromicrobium sp. P5_D10]